MTTDTPRSTKASAFEDQLLKAEATSLEAEAEIKERQLREQRLDFVSRNIRLVGGLGSQMSAALISIFSRWNRLDARLGTKAPRTVFMNCSGGRFADTFAIYDLLRLSQADGGPDVTVQTTGVGGTFAAIAMQAAKQRVMTPRSWLILSEIQPGDQRMNTTGVEEAVAYMKWLEDRGWNLLVQRSTKLDIEQIKKMTEYGRQWWISAAEALALGIIDEVGTVMPHYAEHVMDPALVETDGDDWVTRFNKARLRKFYAESDLAAMTTAVAMTSTDEAGKHYLFGPINEDSCTRAQRDLTYFAQRNLPDVELIIDSSGGSCFDGSGLMDVIEQTMNQRQFTTTIFGECASMAGFIAMTGQERIMTTNAAFLIHRVSNMFGLSSSHAADNAKNMRRLEDILFPYMVSRTDGKLSLEELKDRCKNNDWWLTADECLKKGLVRKVV